MIDQSVADLVGKHIRDLAEAGFTMRAAATELGMSYDRIWKLASRRGIKFKRSDGNVARAQTWAAKQVVMAEAVMDDDDDPRPPALSDEAIAALYRGRRYQDAKFRRWMT